MNYFGNSSVVTPDLEHLNLPDQLHNLLNLPNGYIDRFVKVVGNANITSECVRLVVNVGDLRAFDSDICDALFKYPNEVILAVKEVVQNVLKTQHFILFNKLQVLKIPLEIGFCGFFGKHQLTPRGISAKLLGNLVKIEGTVTKLSPKLVSNLDKPVTTEKENMNVIDENMFIDVRSAILQECPDSIPSGQLPRSVQVFLPYELGGTLRPGQKVAIAGIFTTNPFPVLEANHIIPFEKLTLAGMVRSSKVLEYFDAYIKANNMQDNLFEKMARSVAPSMMVDEAIKQALLLQLFGGCRRRSKSGLTVRGDIHCLLIGSPGVGKSQLLRSMHKLAPQCIITSGRGSTAAGLTAAIKTDQFTKIKTLEAGAVVMADNGFVCIDEFDKMSEKDRVALHEAMEQQTVTIAKAGLHTTLNARCSVLAAANPLYGSYNENISVHKNVALPDSLLSRFDLLFLLFDRANTSHDRALSNHVLSLRRGLTTKTLDSGFLKRYIAFSRKEIRPVLTSQTRALIVAEYVDLRREARTKVLPATPRLLETLIRLVTASARAHLRKTVNKEDCKRVFKIMRKCLLGYDESTSTKVTAYDKKKIFLTNTVQLEQDGITEISFEELLQHLNKTNQGEAFSIDEVSSFSNYFQEQGEFDVEDGKLYF